MKAPKEWKLWMVVATALLAFHFVVEFVAWASHPGNSVPGSGGSDIPWRILSFPVFLLIAHNDVNFFWEAMIINSLFWSIGLTLIAKRIWQRSKTPTLHP
jgi:hypothetical protein